MEWLCKFPHMNDEALRSLKQMVDESFRPITRGYGDVIEATFYPLGRFLVWAEC